MVDTEAAIAEMPASGEVPRIGCTDIDRRGEVEEARERDRMRCVAAFKAHQRGGEEKRRIERKGLFSHSL